MNELTISITDLLAVLMRKGKKIMLFAICFAVLLGGYKGYSTWQKMNDEEWLNLEQMEYDQELLKLERKIEKANRYTQQREEYMNNSFRMQINPYDKNIAEIYLVISGIDENAVEMTFGDTVTPIEYLTEKIATQYELLWAAQDLSSQLKLEEYKGVLNKYIIEMVSFGYAGGGILKITAVGRDAVEANALAEEVCSVVMKMHSTAVKNSYSHTISRLDKVEQSLIDADLADYQAAQYELLDSYQDSIIEAEKEIKKLDAPDTLLVAALKMAIIGGVVGAALACVWYCCKAMLQGLLQSSAHGEKVWEIPFVGSISANKGLFKRLANWVSGELVWKDEEQALDYIVQTIKLRAQGKNLLLISTLDLKKHEAQLDKLRKTLRAGGMTVMTVDDAMHNPKAMARMDECDDVLLVEAVDRVKMEETIRVLQLAKECDKRVLGFMTV